MIIPKKDWLSYINRLSKLNSEAANAVKQYVEAGGWSEIDDIVAYAYGVEKYYGEGAAALAAEMFDAVAEASGVYAEPAIMAETASYGDVAKTVKGVLKTSQNVNELAGAVSRLVKKAGADTTVQNVNRYNRKYGKKKHTGAQFAWVPVGDTCPFCLMLASNGWQNQTRGGEKHAEHIHSNCDCNYSVRFDDHSGVQGYDPDTYKEMFESIDGDTWDEKVNAMRRHQYEQNKDKINAQKRAAYAERKRNELLMIEATSPFKNPKTPITIYAFDQSKHIIGGQKYNEYMKTHEYPPSYLTISSEEAQKLVDKYHGTGILKLDKNGNVMQSEKIVDNDIVIGYAVNNVTGEKVTTTGFKIHYSGKGTHIVPMYENQKQYWKERREKNGHDWLLRQKS